MHTEIDVITATHAPRTRQTLASDLRALGVTPGDVLLVHSSLRALGWVAGAEVAVVQALRDALGPSGVLVVPAQTGGNSDPAEWTEPPVPETWWPRIRAEMPAYDAALTPSEGIGRIAEAVRTWPGAVRSAHPQTSFAALGPGAAELLARHDLDCRFGARSPLAPLAAAGARVLLLGAGHATCTAYHLGESRVPGAPSETLGCAVADGHGGRRWTEFTDTVADSADFTALGAAFEIDAATHLGPTVRRGRVGSAASALFDLAAAADFATRWIFDHRPGWAVRARPRTGSDR